jgi:D-alanine-D-alanine ligase
MGGDSQERDVSRVSGLAVARALESRGHDVFLIDTESGRLSLPESCAYRVGSAPPESVGALVARESRSVTSLADDLTDVDVVFIALHGGWGEDGTIQALFEIAKIPYTGSGVLGSALAMDKDRAKRVASTAGVDTPDWITLDFGIEPLDDETILERVGSLTGDLVVKPNAEGSTVGLTVVREGDDALAAVRFARRYDRRVLVERFVPGRELTVGIVGDEALPIVEIIPPGGIYTYEAKYTKGKSQYVAPAQLPEDLAERIRASARTAFHALGCEGFGRVDFRLPPDGRYQFLEVNTIPGMTPLSLLPMAAGAAGMSFDELIERIVDLGAARAGRSGAGASA